MGHFLGVNTDCLPPGTTIPAEEGESPGTAGKVHFGKGTDTSRWR